MVNELKQLCEKMGIDIWEVLDAAAVVARGDLDGHLAVELAVVGKADDPEAPPADLAH